MINLSFHYLARHNVEPHIYYSSLVPAILAGSLRLEVGFIGGGSIGLTPLLVISAPIFPHSDILCFICSEITFWTLLHLKVSPASAISNFSSSSRFTLPIRSRRSPVSFIWRILDMVTPCSLATAAIVLSCRKISLIISFSFVAV